jgi:hypothetical protein
MMLHTGRNEQEITRTDAQAGTTIHQLSGTPNHNIDFIAIVRRQGNWAGRRQYLYNKAAMLKYLNKPFPVGPRQLSQSFLDSYFLS